MLNNTGYNTISLSALAGWQGKKLTATLFSSIYYQRSGIYYASKISDLSQLIKRFEYGRPDPETVKPFSYEIKPPFQQSQHVTLKGELKWELNPNHHLNFTLSFQENLRQEFENRKKTQWSWIPMQDLMLKTYKFDVLWQAKWKLWKMTTDAGLSNTYQTNFNYPGTKQPAFVPNFAALSMGGYFLHKAEFEVVVVGVVAEAAIAIDRQHTEVVTHTEGTLQLTKLCLMKEISTHRQGCKVRNKSRLFRTWIVEVRLVGIRKTSISCHLP